MIFSMKALTNQVALDLEKSDTSNTAVITESNAKLVIQDVSKTLGSLLEDEMETTAP
jgi:hypothetical protein